MSNGWENEINRENKSISAHREDDSHFILSVKENRIHKPHTALLHSSRLSLKYTHTHKLLSSQDHRLPLNPGQVIVMYLRQGV